jgi:hypothetical protein
MEITLNAPRNKSNQIIVVVKHIIVIRAIPVYSDTPFSINMVELSLDVAMCLALAKAEGDKHLFWVGDLRGSTICYILSSYGNDKGGQVETEPLSAYLFQ